MSWYLQITTKCNMTCPHCCFNCDMKGIHGTKQTILDAISFINDYEDEVICIGGGEPTLHPDFFEILEKCLYGFDYTWLATNGSQTDSMFSLADIMINNEYTDLEDSLRVALSQDSFHDPINKEVINLWEHNTWEIRNAGTGGLLNQGRTKENQLAANDGCACTSHLIQPNGKIRLCGCLDSPIIGNIYNGIEEEWEIVINSDEFRETECHQNLNIGEILCQ